MAEFEFHATWDDSASYLAKLAALTRYKFIIKMTYPSMIPYSFLSPGEEVKRLIREKGYSLLMFLGQESTPFLHYEWLEKNRDYWIDPDKSHPSIELHLPHGARKEGNLLLYPGWLSYPSKFYNSDTLECMKPPEDIKLEYKFIVKFLKKEMEKFYVSAHRRNQSGVLTPYLMPLWIGKNALELLEAKEAVIPFGKRNLSVGELLKSKNPPW